MSFWDFRLLFCCFDVQSDKFSRSIWTSACFPAALTSNPTHFLVQFGPLPAFSPQQRPIRTTFSAVLDFCHASHSFDVQSDMFSFSFRTFAMIPAASKPNPCDFTLPGCSRFPTRKRIRATPVFCYQHCSVCYIFNFALISSIS